MPSRLLVVPTDHPSFAGHFPGQPVLPGVVLLGEVIESLGTEAPLQVNAVKFLSPVGPGARLRIDWTTTEARVRFDVRELLEGTERTVASGQLDLGDPA